MTTKNYTVILNSFFINVAVARKSLKKLLDRNPFEKRLDRKTKQQSGRRDQPAQRLWHNPFEKRLDRKTKQQSGRRDQPAQRLLDEAYSKK